MVAPGQATAASPSRQSRRYLKLIISCHSEVRILPPQPASAVSVGHFWLRGIQARFLRVSEMQESLCGSIFWTFGVVHRFQHASLGLPIFNIRVATAETLFEVV
jgi:hypothetical protein